MIIVGCDFHTRFQQIAMVNAQTGELVERRLEHESGDAERFYATLPGPARVGMEATINTQWFERMLHRYQHDLAFQARGHYPRTTTPNQFTAGCST